MTVMIHRTLGIGVFLYFCFSVSLFASQDIADAVDSLKQQISVYEDSLANRLARLQTDESAFDAINMEIYQHKRDIEKNDNPLLQLQLDRALRAARQLGDKIGSHHQRTRHYQLQLQQLYKAMIAVLEEEIERLAEMSLRSSNSGINKRRYLDAITALETDKAHYYRQLATRPISNNNWATLEPNPSDTPNRLRLKNAILQEQLEKSLKQIEDRNQRQQAIAKDKKLYREMLGFYAELSQGIDDEQEFFDRTKISELNDQLDQLDSEATIIETELQKLHRNVTLIRQKLERFRLKLGAKG